MVTELVDASYAKSLVLLIIPVIMIILMLKGWNLLDGSWYYFQPEGDSCGRALTGWQWIDGNGDGTAECYYLDPERRGAMAAGCITPDGYQVDDEGRWILEGRIVTRTRE